jgi:predicted O-linked N-acetylglucosamine transferase (SPINDLY family)
MSTNTPPQQPIPLMNADNQRTSTGTHPSLQEINTLVALFSAGRLTEAATLAQEMTVRFPQHEFGWKALGEVFKQMGRKADALAPMQQAAALSPDDVEAHYNLGNTFKDLGRLVEAEASYRRALQINPNFAAAYSNLGNILKNMGRLDEAETSYRQALQLTPDFADAYNNLGNLLKEMGRLNEAEVSYRQALHIKPNFAEAHYNLGNTLKELIRLDEAEISYRQALQINPDIFEAHSNLGLILKDRGRLDEAEASLRRALQIKPDYAEAYSNLGSLLKDLGRLDEAEASYRRALQIKPDFSDAHSNLIFTLDMKADVDTASLQEERKRWDAAHAAHLFQQRTHSNNPDSERRLRIGYVSADFREHSAAYVFGAMLVNFDPHQFEVFAYSNSIKEDALTRHFQQSVTCWRKIVGLSDEAVADLIRKDEIDILVDLSGHSAGNRLLVFARKPAPIQVTAWGYIGGTGMRAMDVFFADSVVVPPEEKPFYAEQVRYLPNVVGSFFLHAYPPVNALPALSGKGITFGSFNRLSKISEDAYRVWAQILLAIPDSRMIIKSHSLDDASMRERVTGYFTRAGIAPERILLLGKTSRDEHLAAFNQVDITLDPFPHGGGVTALEGLMMGVPVITLRWPTLVGRLSASIMTTLELADWIAETQEEYIKLAMRKASDLQSLAKLRQQLRGIFTSSIMGDQVAYVRAVEQEYRQLWQEWCSSVKDEFH